MVWFRVDDGWHKHRKRLRLGIDLEGMAAQGLWVAAGSWAGDELTDGWVPAYVVDYLAPGIGRRLAERLVAAGLWVPAKRDGEDGWEFHQWIEQQRTREQVMAERAGNARRQALTRDPALREAVRSRDANRCRYCAVPVDWKDRRSGSGGTFDHVDPDGPNTFDNLVVACRACNAAKGCRTPKAAGMKLLQPGETSPARTQNVSRYAPKTHLGSAQPPTRPDPTRPDPTRPVLPTEVRKDPPPEGGADAPLPGTDVAVPRNGAGPINAGAVVAAYIEGAKEKRRTVTGRIRQQVGQTAKRLIDAGDVPAAALLDAAREMGRRGWKDLDMQILRTPEANGSAAASRNGGSTHGSPAADRLAAGMALAAKLDAEADQRNLVSPPRPKR